MEAQSGASGAATVADEESEGTGEQYDESTERLRREIGNEREASKGAERTGMGQACLLDIGRFTAR